MSLPPLSDEECLCTPLPTRPERCSFTARTTRCFLSQRGERFVIRTRGHLLQVKTPQQWRGDTIARFSEHTFSRGILSGSLRRINRPKRKGRNTTEMETLREADGSGWGARVRRGWKNTGGGNGHAHGKSGWQGLIINGTNPKIQDLSVVYLKKTAWALDAYEIRDGTFEPARIHIYPTFIRERTCFAFLRQLQ